MGKLLTKILIIIGSFIMMLGLSVLIIFAHIAKLFNYHIFYGSIRDPFHDSRQHPLRDPNAPRG